MWVMLLGGPSDGQLVDVDMRRVYEFNVPKPVPNPMFSASDPTSPPFTSFTVERYRPERIQLGDGWVQWILVHTSYYLGTKLDAHRISLATMVQATMECWRATWARTKCKHCGERIINRYRYGQQPGVWEQVLLPEGWQHASGPTAGLLSCNPQLAPYGTTLAAPQGP